MPPLKQRGSRVVYVAASAGDLPPEVQDWLSQANNRATASPHIHDLLAALATGARPTAIIVNVSEVDWSEMDFFDYVHRLSPQTTLYVAGFDHEKDKLEAACERGATRFDADRLTEESEQAEPTHTGAPSDLLAGAVAVAPGTDQPESSPEPEEPDESSPHVRLVHPGESEEKEEKHDDRPVPFPWSPSPERPQRTPPPKYPPPPVSAHTPPPVEPAATEETPAAEKPGRSSIELTAEELAALVGRPIDINHDRSQEKRQ
jgi:hypothetical protein